MPFEICVCMVGNSAQPPFPLPSSTSSLFWELRVAYPTAPQTKVKRLMQFFHFSWEPGPATAICMSSQYIFHFGDLWCLQMLCLSASQVATTETSTSTVSRAAESRHRKQPENQSAPRSCAGKTRGVMCDAIWLTVSFCKMGPPNSDGRLPELLPQHSVISSNCFWLQVHLTDHAYIRMACNYHFCPRSDQICIL